MPKIIVYTTEYCPYCVRAKALLSQRGVAFEEVRLSEDDDNAWDELFARSKLMTVPQIFADGRILGGFAELAELDRKDQLGFLKGGA